MIIEGKKWKCRHLLSSFKDVEDELYDWWNVSVQPCINKTQNLTNATELR